MEATANNICAKIINGIINKKAIKPKTQVKNNKINIIKLSII
jgi:hypothetical protein